MKLLVVAVVVAAGARQCYSQTAKVNTTKVTAGGSEVTVLGQLVLDPKTGEVTFQDATEGQTRGHSTPGGHQATSTAQRGHSGVNGGQGHLGHFPGSQLARGSVVGEHLTSPGFANDPFLTPVHPLTLGAFLGAPVYDYVDFTGLGGAGFGGAGFTGTGFNGAGFGTPGFGAAGFSGAGFNGAGLSGSGVGQGVNSKPVTDKPGVAEERDKPAGQDKPEEKENKRENEANKENKDNKQENKHKAEKHEEAVTQDDPASFKGHSSGHGGHAAIPGHIHGFGGHSPVLGHSFGGHSPVLGHSFGGHSPILGFHSLEVGLHPQSTLGHAPVAFGGHSLEFGFHPGHGQVTGGHLAAFPGHFSPGLGSNFGVLGQGRSQQHGVTGSTTTAK